MVLLSKIKDTFSVPGRGCVIVPIAITTTIHNGDAIQLRSASGKVIDAHITGIELIKVLSGPCRVGLLLSKNVSKADVPSETEIWVDASK